MNSVGVPLKMTDARLSRGMDFLLATPLILWCALGAAGFVLQILHQKNGGGAIGEVTIVADLASGAFLLQKAVLLCLRRPPLLRCADNWARAWTLIVANLDVSLLLFPRSTPSPLLNLVSAAMLLTGTVASIAVLAWLGRSFAVMPQARRLVVEGPYRLVRHPLYVTEEIASLGLALQFVRPWGLLLAISIFVL